MYNFSKGSNTFFDPYFLSNCDKKIYDTYVNYSVNDSGKSMFDFLVEQYEEDIFNMNFRNPGRSLSSRVCDLVEKPYDRQCGDLYYTYEEAEKLIIEWTREDSKCDITDEYDLKNLWEFICYRINPNQSIVFLDTHKNSIPDIFWETLFKSKSYLTDEFVEHFIDKVVWNELQTDKLSYDFIMKYKDKVNWWDVFLKFKNDPPPAEVLAVKVSDMSPKINSFSSIFDKFE